MGAVGCRTDDGTPCRPCVSHPVVGRDPRQRGNSCAYRVGMKLSTVVTDIIRTSAIVCSPARLAPPGGTMTSRLLLSTALVTLFLLPVAAWAQATADMNGRVTDQSGAVLPGVTITVTQTDTGLVRSVVADSDGAYAVSY